MDVLEKEGIYMAGLQITPGMSGISAPTAPTTRTATPADSVSTGTSQVSSTAIRTPEQREGSVDRAVNERREREQTARTQETEKQRETAALENVVSVSEDGDTVQVSDDGATELSESTEGAVVSTAAAEADATRGVEEDIEIEPIEAPEIEPIEAPEITPITATTDTADSQAANITSFVGYTDQQVEQMYLEGEISQNDYNNEIARREEIEQGRRDEAERFGETMGRLEEADSRVERADFAIESAIKSGNEKIGLNERLSAVDSVFEERESAVRRQQEAGRLWDYQLQV